MTNDLPAHWTAAIRRAPVVESLEALYRDVAARIEARGPACWASGRCCNFARAGHCLYATGLETAYTLAQCHRSRGVRDFDATTLPLTRAVVDAALARGGCPFQVANLCGVHAIRPLGCRVYFCDRSAQEWQRELYEQAMAQLRALHDQHAIEYRYGEWREMLGLFASDVP